MDYISLADRDVSIQMIDFISSVLKVQYNARHEFISPSSVYSIACRGDIFGNIYIRFPKGLSVVRYTSLAVAMLSLVLFKHLQNQWILSNFSTEGPVKPTLNPKK